MTAARLLVFAWAVRRSAFTTPPDPWRRTVVAGWAVLTLAAAGYVAAFGRDAPWVDEWMLLPALVGERPVLPWLWEAHNEHRFPLPRLVWYVLFQISDHDFRSGMAFSVAALSAAAWALMGAARDVRGRSHPADLFLPALLLNLGHHENLLLGYQVAFTLPVALTLGVLAVAVRPTPGRVALAGWMTLLVGLCGGAGVLLAGPLAAWVIVAAFFPRSGPANGRTLDRRWRSRYARVLVVVPLGIVVVYAGVCLLGHRPNPALAATTAGWGERVRVAGEVLAGGLGALGRTTWPVSAVGVAFVLGCAVFALVPRFGLPVRLPPPLRGKVRVGGQRFPHSWDRSPVEAVFTPHPNPPPQGGREPEAVGVALVLVAGLVLAAAIGVGRAGTEPGVGFSSRYAVFGAVPLTAAYFALLLYGPARFARVGQSLAVAAAVLVTAFAVRPGLAYGEGVRYRQLELYYAVKAGLSPDEVAARCVTRVLTPADSPRMRAALADGLRVLERHQIGCYRPRDK